MKTPALPPPAINVCFFVFALCIGAFQLRAQTYNLTASTTTFAPVTGATAIDAIEVDGGLSASIPIGFSFTYFGTAYTTFKASSNGFISFKAALADHLSTNVIETNADMLAAALWDDLSGEVDGGSVVGTASYRLTGAAGSQVLTVEWLNWLWDWEATNPAISFQIKLYEGTNKIDFIYRQEATAPSGALGASIGLTGDAAGEFYSLDNTNAAPTLSVAGNNLLTSRPATGQVYTFTPAGAAVTPTVAASNILQASDGFSMDLSWTNGDGSNRAVFMKQTAAAESFPAVDGTAYSASASFGTAAAGSGWFCVYNGAASTVDVTNLQLQTSYRIHVVEYNGSLGGEKYMTTAGSNNPLTAVTPNVTPGPPYSSITLLHASASQVTFDITEGTGTKRAIFVKAANTGTAPAVNNTTYTANTTFGSGTQIGSSGWYCVFNGTVTSNLTVTGLSPSTQYRVHAVDYNGTPGTEMYHTATETLNPVTFTTFAAVATPAYTFAASSGTFTPLSGGTAVDALETDNAVALSVPVGFTFEFGGHNFTQGTASSNGFFSFSPFAIGQGSTPTNDLDLGFVRPLIAPLWDDLGGFGGQASYQTTGSTPNRIFTFEWLNWRWLDAAGAPVISFQIKLYESDGKIEMVYRQEATPVSGPSASIGLAFLDLGSGNFLSLNNSGAAPTASSTAETATIAVKPANGQIYSFTPPVLTDQTITFNPLAAKTFGDAPFALTATASSGLSISYSSSDTNVATISGSTVTIVGAGTTTITASQAGNGTYNPATPVPQALTVNKASPTITFGALAAKTFGDAPFALGATASSGLVVSYSSSDTNVATISGNSVTIAGVGTTTITASQAGNSNYNAATSVLQNLTVNKANQTITFGALAGKTFGDAPFALTATASSGLTIGYSSSDTNVATLSGNTVTIVGAGSCTITASQAGNSNYNAATSVPQTLSVAKANQTITFTALAAKTFGDMPFALTGTASSGLTVSFSSSNTGVATISGTTMTIIAAGSTNITASQAGNNNYNAATNVVQGLTVNKANQTITFNELSVKSPGDAPFTISATSSSGLTVSFSSSDNGVATVSGNTITIVGVGSCNITASQAGNSNFNAATDVVRVFFVRLAQTITFTEPATKTVGDAPFPLSATSSASLTVAFSTSSDKATISGNTVTIVKAGSVTINADQAGNATFAPAPTVSRTFCINPAKPAITVSGLDTEAPLLTSSASSGNQWYKDGTAISGATNATFSATQPGSYTVVATVDNCSSVASNAEVLIVTATEDLHDSISVYPNPAGHELIVDVTDMTSAHPAEVQVNDLNGKLMSRAHGRGVIKMNITDYASGAYLVVVRVGEVHATRRIIKK